jgi:hypothetical protein
LGQPTEQGGFLSTRSNCREGLALTRASAAKVKRRSTGSPQNPNATVAKVVIALRTEINGGRIGVLNTGGRAVFENGLLLDLGTRDLGNGHGGDRHHIILKCHLD